MKPEIPNTPTYTLLNLTHQLWVLGVLLNTAPNPTPYTLVESPETLEILLPIFRGQDPILAVDIETTSLNPRDGEIRLIQVSHKNGNGEVETLIYDVSKGGLTESVKDALSDLFTSCKLVAHNAVFEAQWFQHNGVSFCYPLFDTMIASQLLLNGYPPSINHGLADVARRELEQVLDKSEQTGDWGTGDLSKSQLEYAAKDAAILLELREVLIPKLVKQGLVEVATIEFRLIPAIAKMSLTGLPFNWELVDQILSETRQARDQQFSEFINTYDREMSRATGVGLDRDLFGDFITPNFNSPKQFIAALGAIGIVTESVSESALTLHPAADHPVITEYLKYKHLVTQCRDWEKYKKHRRKDTGAVHTSVRQILTTGRVSSSQPNIQNLKAGPSRRVVEARHDRMFICADYSQIELRITAVITGDRIMLEAYREDKDLHKVTAAKLYGKPLEDISKAERQSGKPANFGLIYVQSVPAFRDYAESSYGVVLSMEEASQFHRKFFDLYRGVREWQRRTEVAIARTNHYISKTLSGRARHLFGKDIRITTACNNPVQGTGADIVKLAMASTYEEYDREAIDAVIINMVHDELLVECHQSCVERAREILIRNMEAAAARYLGDLPCEVEAGIGKNWNEAKL